ncbi:MAG: glycosyltransferase [Terrimicrobiaceae bacterium]|nr:glycosyltransferase [Terrimicrobiaceae bacterium]
MGNRVDAETIPGGDVVQMRKTAREFEAHGVRVEFFAGANSLPPCDIVHVFNTTRVDATYEMVMAAEARGIPVVVSTIWHSMEEMRRAYARIYRLPIFPIWSYMAVKELYYRHRAGQRFDLDAMLSYRRRIRDVVAKADAILPNSLAELEHLKRETAAVPRRAFIIPNGCEARRIEGLPWSERTMIVYAGRLEPRKNQTGVARAFRAMDRPPGASLWLYGATKGAKDDYARRVAQELVGLDGGYGGELTQPDLFDIYSRARVVVLASFFETTGLVILEALAHGCSAVITDSPTTREYFGNLVEYCDPYDTRSIAAAMQRAWSAPPRDCSALLAKYSWKEAARKTFEAYQSVLAGAGRA